MIKVGLIGCGGIAGAHLRALAAFEERARLVAALDANPEQSRRVGEEYRGITVAQNSESFWDVAMDAVIITVPNRYHRAYVEAAAARGLAIFCEKPLAANLADAAAMTAAVERAGVVNLVGFKNRYFGGIQALHRLLGREGLGALFAYREVCSGARLVNPSIGMEWRMREEIAGGGAVADFGSHSLDMATWLFTPQAGPLVNLDGRLATFIRREGCLPSNDDMALLSGRFASGALFSALDSRVGPGLYQVEVYGALGRARVDLSDPDRLHVSAYAKGNEIAVDDDASTSLGNPFTVQMDRFLRAVAEHRLLQPDFATALSVQRWIEIARANAR